MSNLFKAVLILTLSVAAGAAASDAKPASRARVSGISPEASKALLAAEARFSRSMEACSRAKNKTACEAAAKNVTQKEIAAILDKNHIKASSGGILVTAGDCFNGPPECKTGKLEKIAVPCTHCLDAHIFSTSGNCFLYVCVIEKPW